METLLDATRRYLVANRLRSRTLLYNVSRFIRETRKLHIQEIRTTDFDAFRSSSDLSAWTVEKTITDVLTVLRWAGQSVAPGKRLQRPRPLPTPCSLGDIGATWRDSPAWLRQWMVLAYWTGARLSDTMRMQLGLGPDLGDTLSLDASKTRRVHQWPVPDWLRRHLTPLSLPYGRTNDHAARMVRVTIASVCNCSNVRQWLPRTLRQRSITEWSRANGQAGAILHGSGLGVLNHYVEPLSVLQAASDRVRVPDGWRADTVDDATALVAAYRRCDPQAQQIVWQTTERLAQGA